MAVEFIFSDEFSSQIRKVPPDIRKMAWQVLKRIKENPSARSPRTHRLTNVRPPVHKVDLCSNHAWQMTMRIEGEKYTILDIGTHKQMDRKY